MQLQTAATTTENRMAAIESLTLSRINRKGRREHQVFDIYSFARIALSSVSHGALGKVSESPLCRGRFSLLL